MTAYQRLIEEIMQVFGVGELLMQLAIVGTARVLVSPLLAPFGLTGDLNFDIITLCIRVVPLGEASHFGFSEKSWDFPTPGTVSFAIPPFDQNFPKHLDLSINVMKYITLMWVG